jgi:hypothetical protein
VGEEMETFDQDGKIDYENLKAADPEEQKEIMREWFLSNYENPVECLPYDSKEGGYIYIWGGPFDANDELSNEFGGIVSDDVLNELIEELESESDEWSGNSSPEGYDDYLLGVITSDHLPFMSLSESINKTRILLGLSLNQDIKQNMNRLLHVSVISAVETYLSDSFIGILNNKPEYLRRFIETSDCYMNKIISVSDIYRKVEIIELEAKKYLVDMIWHNLARVKEYFNNTLDVSFPEDMKKLFIAIDLRHDIVHRNGKNKKGDELYIEDEHLMELIDEVISFADHIETQLREI